jgi:hypothetical protein
VVASSDEDKRLRAELAAELGWYPADLDDESKKWAHLTELARQREVEAKGRAEVADLYE